MDRKKWPTIAAYLTRTTYDDGAKRETSTFSFFAAGGKVTVRVNDRDTHKVAFTTVDSLAGLLDALEAVLAQNRLDWKDDKFNGKSRR